MDKPLKSPARNSVQNTAETTWVFDLDNTLYPAECDLFALIDQKMGEFLSNFFLVDRVEARRIQKDYFVRFGTTLQGLIKLHGVVPEEFLNFVHDIDLSAIKTNHQLKSHLSNLKGKKFVFTNGDVPYATRVLERIGILQQLDGIFDIAQSNYIPKPNPEAFERFFLEFDFDPQKSVMFEDMARNLIPASKAGMTTVWIKTSSEWGAIDYQSEHIHYETHCIIDWFETHMEKL